MPLSTGTAQGVVASTRTELIGLPHKDRTLDSAPKLVCLGGYAVGCFSFQEPNLEGGGGCWLTWGVGTSGRQEILVALLQINPLSTPPRLNALHLV